MIAAGESALAYTDAMERESFLADAKTQQAVIYNILVIGEAASMLANESPEYIARHPELPWKQMRGMRNRMAHGYFEIDLNIVWDTVRNSFPALLIQLKNISNSPS